MDEFNNEDKLIKEVMHSSTTNSSSREMKDRLTNKIGLLNYYYNVNKFITIICIMCRIN
jgi:hypothetical protein